MERCPFKDIAGLNCEDYICEGANKTVLKQARSVDTINNASKDMGTNVTVQIGSAVHKECRKWYIDTKFTTPWKKSKILDDLKVHSLRSNQPNGFRYSTHCFLCDMVAVHDNGEQLTDVYRVSSWNCQHAFTNICNIRGDDWAENVKPKLIFSNDLPAMDALYHHQCSINFRIMKNIPRKYINSLTGNELEDKKGRPKDIERSKAFQLVVADFKENNDETITVSDLMEKMGTICDDPYSNTYMEDELKKLMALSLHR